MGTANYTRRWYVAAGASRHQLRAADRAGHNAWLDALAVEAVDDERARRVLAGEMAAACARIAEWHRTLAAERGHDRYDLSQVAMEAVLASLDDYDPSKGPFFPWAYQRARWWVYRLLYAGYLIRLPLDMGQRAAAFRKGKPRWGDEEAPEEARRAMALDNAGGFPPLEEAPEEALEEGGPNDNGEPDSEEEALGDLDARGLYEGIERTGLSERERAVVEYRWGLDGTGTKTLEETAQLFGVTRERIRQIDLGARHKIRVAMTVGRLP